MKALRVILLAVLVAIVQGCTPEPIANFNFSYTDDSDPARISFTNTSTDAETYRWEFGDGDISTEKNPVHTYSNSGTFAVSLGARGKGGESLIIKDVVITLPTTYIVRNLSSFTMYNAITFYTDGTYYYDEVNHGTINSGYQTSEWITTRSAIALYYEYEDGTTALVATNYVMIPNRLNYIDLTDETLIYYDKSTDVNSTEDILSSRKKVTRSKSKAAGSVGVR